MKSAGLSLPLAIPTRRVSHSAVSCGEVSASGRMATRLYPSFVGISFLPLRSAKPAEISFSIMPARVAVVPNPLRSASSGVSSLPAFSIADKRVSSVKAFGGCVKRSVISAAAFSKACPSARGGKAVSGSVSPSCFSASARDSFSITRHPSQSVVLPFAVKV